MTEDLYIWPLPHCWRIRGDLMPLCNLTTPCRHVSLSLKRYKYSKTVVLQMFDNEYIAECVIQPSRINHVQVLRNTHPQHTDHQQTTEDVI